MSALTGVRVLDVGHLTSGPLAAWLLGSLGAEVIKVEPPGGDGGRTILSQAETDDADGGYYFHSTNIDKKSLVADLKTDTGREAVLDLAAEADVLVENYRPGTMADLGLGYETVSARNPELVYCSVTGYGEDNAAAGRRAYDSILQAGSGVMTATGYRDDPPTKVGVSMIDNFASVVAAAAVLGALYHRHRTGTGQFVDISMQDCAAWLVGTLLPFDAERTHHQPADEPYPLAGVFGAADGWLAVAATDNEAAAALRELVAAPEGASPTLEAAVEAWAAERSVADAVESCDRYGVPAVRVADIGDVLSDPTLERAFMGLPVQGESQPMPVSPYALAMGGQERPDTPGPALGEHTGAVLREVAGYDEDRVAELRASGAVGTGPS